jgi:integrase
VAIKHWHTYQGFPNPTIHPLVKKTLTGILHVHGKPAEKASALSIEQLALIVSHLQSRGNLSDWRDNALLQIGFLGALRRSELVALHWGQITFVPEGIEILIARSKTDQIGEGQVCAIPYGNVTLCPVIALQKWQEASQIKTGPIFRRLFKNDQITDKPLTPQSINLIIKSLALECHLPKAKQYSGHSLRGGFATAASQKGASVGAIMRQGRWKHEGTVQGYIALPIGYALSTWLHKDGNSYWWGMVVGVSCSVVLLYFRFNYKIKTYVKAEKIIHKMVMNDMT